MLGLNHETESLHFTAGSSRLFLFTIMPQCLICKKYNSLTDRGSVAFLTFAGFLLRVFLISS